MSWCHIYYIASVILYIYSGYVAASEYYVSAGATCPYINAPCHNLSYYTAYYRSYFTDNTVFYFLEGTHTLQDTLKIINVSNITLQGLGNIKQSFHKTVMQSTSVIICNYSSNIGIKFSSNRDIVLKSLTIANCGGFYSRMQTNVSLLFVDVNIIILEWVSVHNGSGFGLVLVNAFDVLIMKSSFTKNQPLETCTDCLGGNAYILYYNQATNKRLYNVSIIQSNFTFGLNRKGCTRRKDKYIIQSSGGLSISLMNTQSYKIEFIIESVVFYSNIANVGANFLFFSVNTGLYSLIMNNTISTNGKALISSTDNYDCTFGAGMTVLQIYTSNNEPDLIIENCIFADNFAQETGGGVIISSLGSPGNIKFNNCTIYNNKAYHGSGMVLYGLDSALLRFHIRDILFDSNKVPNKFDRLQSAVLLVYIDNVTFERIEVSNHDTTGLLSYNSQLTFYKNSNFVNNSGTLGGGMALYGSSHLILKEPTNISFVNNYASESGGGIFVLEAFIAREFINTYCFFKHEHDHSSTATLYFVNNKAIISGDVLYGGNVDYCLNGHDFLNLFNYSQQTGLSAVSSDPIKVCFCEEDSPNCSVTNINITAMPGIKVNISLATVGSKDGLTKGVIKLTGLDSSFKVQTVNTRLNSNCTDVTFSVTTNSSLNTTQVYVTLEKSFLPLYDPLGKMIKITFHSCPFAFPLDITNNACACMPQLEKTPTITCNVNTQTITRHGEMWIGYNNDNDCVIIHQNCPFDYCSDNNISFTFNMTKEQCLHNRSGLLCGQCDEGLSLMLGSNRCGQCTNNHLALIIPFALAGIALVAFVIVLNLTVSVGTINGLIFYANVVKIYEHIFFPNGPVKFLSHFISWLNLDLGIETCFSIGMGSCSKIWLQFVFPVYVWFLLILIIILSRYSIKVVRLVGRQVIPVLATMILLSYTKLIRTVFQVLHQTNIQCSDKNHTKFYLSRWYIDATVEYLKGCHLPLFLFSLAVLILLIVPYSFYLLTIPLFEGPLSKYMCCQKMSIYMKPFFDAYGGPYKDKCRFWTGFLLLVRVVLALVVSLDTDAAVSLDVLTSISVVIIFMYFPLRGVYRQYPLVYLELFFIINLNLMASIDEQTFTISKGQVSIKVLLSLAFVVFFGILFYHIWDRFLKSHLQKKIQKMFKAHSNILTNDNNKIDLQTMSSTDSITYSLVPELREPLLDDENDILFKK